MDSIECPEDVVVSKAVFLIWTLPTLPDTAEESEHRQILKPVKHEIVNRLIIYTEKHATATSPESKAALEAIFYVQLNAVAEEMLEMAYNEMDHNNGTDGGGAYAFFETSSEDFRRTLMGIINARLAACCVALDHHLSVHKVVYNAAGHYRTTPFKYDSVFPLHS